MFCSCLPEPTSQIKVKRERIPLGGCEGIDEQINNNGVVVSNEPLHIIIACDASQCDTTLPPLHEPSSKAVSSHVDLLAIYKPRPLEMRRHAKFGVIFRPSPLSTTSPRLYPAGEWDSTYARGRDRLISFRYERSDLNPGVGAPAHHKRDILDRYRMSSRGDFWCKENSIATLNYATLPARPDLPRPLVGTGNACSSSYYYRYRISRIL